MFAWVNGFVVAVITKTAYSNYFRLSINLFLLDKIIPEVQDFLTMKSVTISDAARIKGVTRQAVHAAIKSGKLKTVTVTIKTPCVVIAGQSLDHWQPNPNMRRAGRRRKDGG